MSGRKRALLTQSLLSSWIWRFNNATETRDPNEEFIQTLRREPLAQTPAMIAGIAFEDAVTAVVNGKPIPPGMERFADAVKEVAAAVGGGSLQHTAYADASVKGYPLLLYGKLDALKAGVIYDIKHTGSYEAGKFRDSPQHPLYFRLVPEAREFTYLVHDYKHGDVCRETYTRDMCEPIGGTIREFLEDLERDGLIDLYLEKWAAL